jgi:predicted DNA-binding ribbon-helix-helix protein
MARKRQLHSVVLAGRKTSISLEAAIWNDLRKIAHDRGESESQLVDTIDRMRQHKNLSSAIRVFVLEYYRAETEKRRGS